MCKECSLPFVNMMNFFSHLYLKIFMSRCECRFFFVVAGVPLPLLFALSLQIFVIIGVAFCARVMNVTFSFYNMHPPFGKLALLPLLCRRRQSPLHLVFTHMVSTRHCAVISSRTQNLPICIPHSKDIFPRLRQSLPRSTQHFCEGREQM